jgi:hypothetical protein
MGVQRPLTRRNSSAAPTSPPPTKSTRGAAPARTSRASAPIRAWRRGCCLFGDDAQHPTYEALEQPDPRRAALFDHVLDALAVGLQRALDVAQLLPGGIQMCHQLIGVTTSMLRSAMSIGTALLRCDPTPLCAAAWPAQGWPVESRAWRTLVDVLQVGLVPAGPNLKCRPDARLGPTHPGCHGESG